MPRKSPLIAEIVIGVVLSGLVGWAYLTRWTPSEKYLNLKIFDIYSRFAPKNSSPSDICIVGVDEESVEKLGRWPWPRASIGQLVDEVAARGAKVIGLNIAFLEDDQNLGLEEVADLQKTYESILNKYVKTFKAKRIPLAEFEDFSNLLAEKIDTMDNDMSLALSVDQSGTVIVPMEFKPGDVLGENLEKLPETITREKLSLAGPDGTFPDAPPAMAAIAPIEPVAKSALAIGFNTFFPDEDGSLRRVAPVMRYGTDFYPSFGIQVLREFLNLQRDALKWDPQAGYQLFKARIPLDDEGKTFVKFTGPSGSFKSYSALEVFLGSIPDNAFDRKIVLLGVNLSGLGEVFITPGGERMTGLEIWAHHLSNILNQDFITRPRWADKAEWLFLLMASLVVILALPLLRARFAIPISTIFFSIFLGVTFFLFLKKGIWVSPAYAVFLLATGFVVLVAKRYLLTEKGKELVEAEGMETNKMLGLSFQGQGMLDMAFEKFRKCPVDGQMKDLLYNLGLDFERKRQFAKAAAVYEHIGAVDAKYKDIQDKIQLLKKAGEGAVFGGVGKKGSESTVVVDGLGQNTTLGRYEVIKELGRGAMGIVYLGRDPKINRQVAIKTLRFEDEVSEDQMKSIKERFFREAESAGNLTHPNIIRIFDAGEDQDVAYIAMELLEGHDLKALCEKNNLLPLPRVCDIVATVANALDYAHKQGVVHRDIKPANIMLLKDNSIRITDFGIARIQTSSKTATGAVLGTPAYMSPEQVNGQKADGRSDLYSLGVTLFELLTGEKPFQADTIAALLYRIANVDHPNPKEYNAKIPDCIVNVLSKALAKKPEDRYQTGADMAKDIMDSIREMITEPASGGTATTQPKTTEPPKAATPTPASPVIIAEIKEEPRPSQIEIPTSKPASTQGPLPPVEELITPTVIMPEAIIERLDKTPIPSEKPDGHGFKEEIKGERQNVPTDFLTELQDAFSISTEKNQPPAETKNGTSEQPDAKKPSEEKTAVLPPEEFDRPKIERTVILPPEISSSDIPTLPNIEHNFHPDNAKKEEPNKDSDKKHPKNWEL